MFTVFICDLTARATAGSLFVHTGNCSRFLFVTVRDESILREA